MSTSPSQLTSEIRAERERLAGLLAGLSAEQWSAPSLCAGWRVREAAAHITMPFRTEPLGYMAGLVRAGFSFHRYADRDARSTARPRHLRYFGVDLEGRRLTATDADVSVGAGARSVHMTAKEILLVVTGRRTLARQSSEGEEATSEPVRRPEGKRGRVRDR
jgi:hypothetical protein